MLEAEMDGMTVYNSELRSAMLLSGTTSVTPLWETITAAGGVSPLSYIRISYLERRLRKLSNR